MLLWCHNGRNIAPLPSEEHHLATMQLGGTLLVTPAPLLGGGFMMCLSGCVAVQRVSRPLPDKQTVLCILKQSGKNDGWGALPKFHAAFLRSPLIWFHPAHFARFVFTSRTQRPENFFLLAKTKYQLFRIT